MLGRALVYRESSAIGVPSRAVQVDPHLVFLGRGIGHFLLVIRQNAALGLQNSQYGVLVGQECKDGSLKTQTTVKVSVEHMAVPKCGS